MRANDRFAGHRPPPAFLAPEVIEAILAAMQPADLRHRFATDYFTMHGRNALPTLSDMLSHTSVKATEEYLGHVGTRSGTVNRWFSRGGRRCIPANPLKWRRS